MRKISLALILLTLIFAGAGCSLLGGTPQVQMKPVKLQYWRIEDDPATLSELITAYRKIHPNVEIVVTKLPAENYDKTLLEALAEDRGPDLFSIPNVWLRGWKPKLLPLPKETTLPTVTVNAQKQVVTVNKKSASLTIRQLLIDYVEPVGKDVVLKGDPDKPGALPQDKIFGLPLSFDTLALFYNKALLKNANIPKPPSAWKDLMDEATTLTSIDDQGKIKQSGAALGAADNVRYYFDVLSAIMMQNGAVMADENGYPSFAMYAQGNTAGHTYPPGVEALMFYDSFVTDGATNRSWSADMPNSLDAFVTGRTAFYFGYPADALDIKVRAPKLDFGIAALPQVDPSKIFNIARYPVEVVSKKTKYANEAWDFLQFISQKDKVSSYLFAAKRPTALRSLINEQMTNPDVGVFVGQILTAKSWYKGVDYPKAEKAFADMIKARPTIESPEYSTIVNYAADVVSGTIR